MTAIVLFLLQEFYENHGNSKPISSCLPTKPGDVPRWVESASSGGGRAVLMVRGVQKRVACKGLLWINSVVLLLREATWLVACMAPTPFLAWRATRR